MVTRFRTNSTITNGTAVNAWSGETVSLTGKRTLGNTYGIIEDDGSHILEGDQNATNKNDAIIYDLLFNGTVNADGTTQRFERTLTTFRLGAGDDVLNLTVDSVRKDLYNIREYTKNVTVDGGDGNDVIWTGSGNDIIHGDVIHFSELSDIGPSGFGRDTIDGGPGRDTIYGDAATVGYSGNIPALSFGGDDISGGNGVDDIYGDVGNFVLATGGIQKLTFGDDTIDGGNGADTIYGDVSGFVINGGVITTLAFGHDIIDGGAGSDVIYGDGESFTVQSVIGSIEIETVTFGDDFIRGGAGNDTIYGDLKDIQLIVGSFGNVAAGTLIGGDDIIEGGSGDDHLWGDFDTVSLSIYGDGVFSLGKLVGGADTFVFARGSGRDVVYDFSHSGGDKIDVSGYGFKNIGSLNISTDGTDTVVNFNVNNSVTLLGVTGLVADDFIFA